MELTKEEAIKLHRELWGWLAENPMKKKSDWPGWEKHERVQLFCFCCEFANRMADPDNCKNCPLEWPELRTASTHTPCGKSYYPGWDNAGRPEERSRLAALIRDLPEKKEVKPAPKFKPGDKVVPVSKSVGASLDEWKKSVYYRDYIVLSRQDHKGAWHDKEHSWFLESDLIPYVEPKVKPEPAKEAFKVGDRVRVNGLIGTVKGVHVETRLTGIEFDEPMGGHDFHGKLDSGYKCQYGYGWYYHAKSIELLPPINQAPENKTLTESKTFVIKGNKTTCVIEIDGVKFTGVAKCGPADEWDEEVGRQWAELRANWKMFAAAEKELRRG